MKGWLDVKKRMLLYLILTSCLFLSSCFSGEEQYSAMGFSKSEYTIVEEKEDRDSFHGDGYSYLILDCSANAEKARSIIEDWTPLPLSENLELLMYGGEKDGAYYGYDLAEDVNWPRIEHGVYKFYNRDDHVSDRSDDTEVFRGHSFNISIAMYDLDKDLLYYLRYDT